MDDTKCDLSSVCTLIQLLTYSSHLAYHLRWLGHILRHDLLLRTTLEGRIQGKKGSGRPRTMFLDWLLKTEEDKISYDELKMLAHADQDGVSEDGNLPYG